MQRTDRNSRVFGTDELVSNLNNNRVARFGHSEHPVGRGDGTTVALTEGFAHNLCVFVLLLGNNYYSKSEKLLASTSVATVFLN